MSIDISHIPPNVLGQIPAVPAPPGRQANLYDPEDRANVYIIVSAVFLALGTTVLGLRIYTKIFIARRFGWEDATLTLGMIGVITNYVGTTIQCVIGSAGKHIWDISLAEALDRRSIVGGYAGAVTSNPACALIKLSILLVYYQLFWPMRWLRLSVYIFAILICGFYAGIGIAMFVFETPRHGNSWVATEEGQARVTPLQLGVPFGVFGIVADTVLLLLPIPAVKQLQMPTRRKVGVVLTFMTGGLSWAASVVGTYFRVEMLTTADYSWYLTYSNIMLQIEMNGGVICASAPVMARAFRHHFPSLKSYVSKAAQRLRSSQRGRTASDATAGDMQHLSDADQLGLRHFGEQLERGAGTGEGKVVRSYRAPRIPSQVLRVGKEEGWGLEGYVRMDGEV